MKENYFPTGNEYVALPTVRQRDGAVEQVNVLHMGVNGLLAFSGGTKAFLTPGLVVNGKDLPLSGKLTWEREADWLPKFKFQEGTLGLEGLYFAPPGERGFILSLKVLNAGASSCTCSLSAEMNWSSLLHSINVTKPLKGDRFLVVKSWEDIPVLEFRAPAPLLALAPYPPDKNSRFSFKKGVQFLAPTTREVPMGEGEDLGFQWSQTKEVAAGESWECFFYFGMGPDEIGAFAVAREFQRMGGAVLKEQSLQWLNERRRQTEDPEVDTLMNRNAFFNRFYATGLTLDTEEAVCLTSRSPRYYVSGAYWDRDSLLWSFPSLLALDPAWAKRVLDYIFTRQARNFGVHSRYLSGAMLEPGFELDEFCAPAIALRSYLEATKDLSFLMRREVLEWMERFEKELEGKKHPKEDLYETWLLPSDDPWLQRYVTYDNVLVWRALTDLAEIHAKMRNHKDASRLNGLARKVKSAILKHCVVKTSKGNQFAWSVALDKKKSSMFYDEPPGSLLLLPHYGFCDTVDTAWKNTRDWIYSPQYDYSFTGKAFEEVGCGHAPHPWVLAAVNSLLSGQKERALKFLKNAKMDNGIACESVDENTGESATGDAFATCAGFLAYGLWHVLGKKTTEKHK